MVKVDTAITLYNIKCFHFSYKVIKPIYLSTTSNLTLLIKQLFEMIKELLTTLPLLQ